MFSTKPSELWIECAKHTVWIEDSLVLRISLIVTSKCNSVTFSGSFATKRFSELFCLYVIILWNGMFMYSNIINQNLINSTDKIRYVM